MFPRCGERNRAGYTCGTGASSPGRAVRPPWSAFRFRCLKSAVTDRGKCVGRRLSADGQAGGTPGVVRREIKVVELSFRVPRTRMRRRGTGHGMRPASSRKEAAWNRPGAVSALPAGKRASMIGGPPFRTTPGGFDFPSRPSTINEYLRGSDFGTRIARGKTMSEHVIRRRITPRKFIILILALPAALAFFEGTAFAGERRDRPAGAANECNPEMTGEWICTEKGGGRKRMNLSLRTDANGVATLTHRWGGAFCGGPCHHQQETFVADGKRRLHDGGWYYAASCNHRTKTKGYKIFRYAFRNLVNKKVVINEYVVLEDGRLIFGSFHKGNRMDGYDVENSSRPPQPDYWEICSRDDG